MNSELPNDSRLNNHLVGLLIGWFSEYFLDCSSKHDLVFQQIDNPVTEKAAFAASFAGFARSETR